LPGDRRQATHTHPRSKNFLNFQFQTSEKTQMTLLFAAFTLQHGLLTVLALLATSGLIGMATSAFPLIASASPDSDTILGQSGNIPDQVQYCTGTADALTGGAGKLGAATPICGKVFINRATGGIDAATLATPAAGLPSAGGNDGLRLTVYNIDGAQQHTITTGSNKINGNKHVFTFAAAVGAKAEFVAWQGIWYCNPAAGDGALT
jgi:hypothetical protein